MASVYVQRNQQGAIIGLFRAPQPGVAEEAIDDRAADVVAFRDRADPAPRDLGGELDALKAKLARAEAAEAVLIEKGTVTKGEIDAKLPARETGDIEAAKP